MVVSHNYHCFLSENWVSDGVLHLRTAFSRDQARKVYVQHLLEEDSQLLWELISDVSLPLGPLFVLHVYLY